MANAVLTTKVRPVYDDLPEQRYHFPKTYLRQITEAVGDLIVYYEPRREGADLGGRSGRQVYFATARVDRVTEDTQRSDHFYAYVNDYLEFPNPVPFHLGNHYFESGLRKTDGSTNKGAFGRAVRLIPPGEFQAILTAGFREVDIVGESHTAKVEEAPPITKRALKTVISERPFRDVAFTRVIRSRYAGACAFTGLEMADDRGRLEVEAAHIRPVSKNGPDSPRNGIALSRTIHWMFDAGLLSVEDSGEILQYTKRVPDRIRRVLNEDGHARWPSDAKVKPHPEFLRYHREYVYKGN